MALTLGVVANFAVSLWPGILYTMTYYKKQTHANWSTIFWEFEVSIWLNALCRLISMTIFTVSIIRIGSCVKSAPNVNINGTMLCLNWTLVILGSIVQVSLMVFYSLGLIYHSNTVF